MAKQFLVYSLYIYLNSKSCRFCSFWVFVLVDAIFNLHFYLQKGAATLQSAGQSMFLPKSAFLALAESVKAGRRFGTGIAQILKISMLSRPGSTK